jgi:hypothetical protein
MSEAGEDSEIGSDPPPLHMTPIYKKIMELEQRAQQNASPSSSVTEPDDTPFQLDGIPEVRIYRINHTLTLMAILISGAVAP